MSDTTTVEEMVAWVDDNEELIKVIPRVLANSDPKYLHREIAGIVVDDQRRVLLQQRSHTKRVLPSVWTVTVAGHVTYGDTLEKTFAKELKEEMHIEVDKPIYLFREKVAQWTETHFCHWYLGKYQGDQVIIEPAEVDNWAWVGEKDYSQFAIENTVDGSTEKMLKRFWSGEWDKLLQ